MKIPTVSVIIPIYNTERYLRRCIDSVISQTFKDIEIILVDDGSPDHGGIIADEYAERYDNISVIHKKNGGLAEARRSGIIAAQGEYIMNVDSDDTIPSDAVQFLYEKCVTDNLDIAYGSMTRYIGGEKAYEIEHPQEGFLNSEEFTAYLLDPICICASCGYIGRKSIWANPIFPDQKFVFPSEDIFINIKLSRYVNKIGLYNHSVYNYYYNSSSISISGRYSTQAIWEVYFSEVEKELKDRDLLRKMRNGLNMLKINIASFSVRPIDPSKGWVKDAVECDTSTMPMKFKILRRLLNYPWLLDSFIKFNRFVKRKLLKSKKY